MPEYLNTCADCLAKITRRRFGAGWLDRFGSTVCRTRHGKDKDGDPILLSAEYHYVFGEEQRRFPTIKREAS